MPRDFILRPLLLAAGSSQRFGSDKLIHTLPDGAPLGVAAALNLQRGAGSVLAITHPHNHVFAALLTQAGIPFLCCPDAEQGMGATLAFAVRATAPADAWLVALGDMPFICPATVAAVAAAMRQGAPLAAPFYRGKRGHPAGFSADFQAELAALQGDTGARAVLLRHAREIQRIETDDPGVLADIDVPGDLA